MDLKIYVRRCLSAIKIIKNIENWNIYFLDYFQYMSNKKIFKNRFLLYKIKNPKIKYIVRAGTTDREILTEIVIHKYYTPKNFEIGEKDIIVDIGAHIGIFSIYAATLAKKGKVFSIEPVRDNFYLLKRNISLNKINNIKPINKAVGKNNLKQIIYINEKNTGGHTIIKKYKKKITVPSITLESIIKKNKIKKIDFLKIDCEGAEYQILLNCPKKILEKIKKISMEYHNINRRYNVNILKTFLEKNEFSVDIRGAPYYMLYATREV